MAPVSAPATLSVAPRPRATVAKPAPEADPLAAARKALSEQLATPLPPVPADRTGQKKWVEQGKARVGAMRKSLEVLREAWFDGKLPFDAYTSTSRKVFDFETQVLRVENALKAADATTIVRPERPEITSCPPYLTPDLVEAMNKNPDSPLNALGVIALPFTLLLDGLNGLSRLSNSCKRPTATRPAP